MCMHESIQTTYLAVPNPMDDAFDAASDPIRRLFTWNDDVLTIHKLTIAEDHLSSLEEARSTWN